MTQGPRVKIGFLGGSFDPVHFGHMVAAQDAFEQHRLDRLVFVPAAQAPLKAHEVQSTPEDRFAMLQRATAGDPRFDVSDVEIRRGGVSYTIDTVRHFRLIYPHDDLYWIIGADQLPKLAFWKDIATLVKLIGFIVLERPGYPAGTVPPVSGLRLLRCPGHLHAISSTELRDRARRELSLDFFVPHKAAVYIQERRLYRQAT